MARRGRPARLSPDAIIDAAEALVRAEGSAALSMRRLARELDATPMALYRHVRDKEDLLRQLLDRSAQQLTRPEPPADPRERVLAVGRAVHDWLVAHSWAIEVLPAHLMGWSGAWIADDIVGALLDGGLPPLAAAHGYQAIWQHIVGELTLTHGRAARGAATAPQATVDDLRRHDLHALARVAGAWPTVHAQDDLDRGLRALVTGLLAEG